MHNFIPLTEDQAKAMELGLKLGEATFAVQSLEPYTSRNGNECLKGTLEVYDDEQNKKFITVYLLLSGSYAFKTLQFFKSIDRMDVYNARLENLSSVVNSKGRCVIGIEKSADGKDRLGIKKYLAHDPNSLINNENTKIVDETLNDDLPF